MCESERPAGCKHVAKEAGVPSNPDACWMERNVAFVAVVVAAGISTVPRVLICLTVAAKQGFRCLVAKAHRV